MLYLILALAMLACIVFTSLLVEDLKRKVTIFLGLGGLTVSGLWFFGGEHAHHVLHHVFLVDYAQFITIPVTTVLIASLALFTITVKKGVGVEWFMLIACPIIGNFGTTWALVPIGLSLVPTLKQRYTDRWLRILILMCIFSMNMLALGTLLADPPQALYAVKMAMAGKPLGFFFPWLQFWPYILTTWFVYWVALKKFGVTFGSPLPELKGIRPAHWLKALYGVGIAVAVGLCICFLRGYEITIVLGIIIFFVGCSSIFFGQKERHDTFHWITETVTIFIAFFSVVCLVHTGLHHISISNQGMIGVVVGLTLGADNAAAFAAVYPQYVALGEEYMVWYNLHPSVTYGGLSPLGNGPQIVLFLVVLTSLKLVTSKRVFVTWFKEAAAFAPYLLAWTLCTSALIELGIEISVPWQMLIGLFACTTCFSFMNLQRLFKPHVDNGLVTPADCSMSRMLEKSPLTAVSPKHARSQVGPDDSIK